MANIGAVRGLFWVIFGEFGQIWSISEILTIMVNSMIWRFGDFGRAEIWRDFTYFGPNLGVYFGKFKASLGIIIFSDRQMGTRYAENSGSNLQWMK
jgi:hypothetical protein